MKKLLRHELFPGWCAAAAALGVYLRTLAPSISSSDAGELAAAASTLGVAHPTGYPLFTLLGRVFSLLPMGDARVIWKLNLMAALCCAAAVFFFFRSFTLLLAETDAEKRSGARSGQREAGEPVSPASRWAAAAAALTLAFSRTFWTQAVAVEVYALHLLLLSVVLWLFLAALAQPGRRDGRRWLLFAFFLGLGFTNHMATILIAPGFLYLYFAKQRFSRQAWTGMAIAIPPFLLGLSAYLYIPIRAAREPLMNWGNPASWPVFFSHVTGEQYRDVMFVSRNVFLFQLRRFLDGFPSESGYVPIAFAIAGLISLFRRARKLLAFSLLLFLGCLLYAVNYEIPDIEAYFLLAHVATAFWIASGLRAVLARATDGARRWAVPLACAAAVLPPLLLNYGTVDHRGDFAAEDYVKNVLDSAEPGAVILTDQDDYLAWTSFYLQLVEKFRPDVTVVDEELLSLPWYHRHLIRRDPRLAADLRSGEMHFLKNPGPGVARAPGRAITRGIIEESYGRRPLYLTYRFNPTHVPGFQYVPSGLLLRFARDSMPEPGPLREFSYRPLPRGGGLYVENIRKNYALAHTNEGSYRAAWGDTSAAETLFRKALEIKPGFGFASEWLNRLGRSPR